MPASTLYWITIISLGLCLLLSLLRRQTAARLKTTQQQLLDERKDRERATSELVHVTSARAAAEKEAAAAKKEAAAKAEEAEAAASLGTRITELEARVKELEGERDAANAARKESALALEEKTKAEAIAQSTITALSREAEEFRVIAATSNKKITELEGKAREAEQAKAAAAQAKKNADTRDAEARAANERVKALEAEIKATNDKMKRLEDDLAKAKTADTATPPPPTVAPAGGGAMDFLAALDADPYTNRGQKETIRMTYTQFTAKKRSS